MLARYLLPLQDPGLCSLNLESGGKLLKIPSPEHTLEQLNHNFWGWETGTSHWEPTPVISTCRKVWEPCPKALLLLQVWSGDQQPHWKSQPQTYLQRGAV